MAQRNDGTVKVECQARGMVPVIHRRTARAQNALESIHTTLGDLVAAAFDTVGNEVKDVAKLLSSRELQRFAGARIVLEQ